MDNTELLKAIAVTVELTGTELSEAGARVLVHDIADLPVAQVLGALKRIRFDGVKVTLGNIMSRLDDGRPQAEEAWAMLPHDESTSAVMTEEMSEAMGVAYPLMREGDMIAARMAFKETYNRLLSKAREQAKPPQWFPSLGTSVAGREHALVDAVRKGRLSADSCIALLPPESVPSALRSLGFTEHPLLESDSKGIAKLHQLTKGVAK